MTTTQDAPKSIGDILKEQVQSAAPTTAATQILAGMQGAGVGANAVVPKAEKKTYATDYTSVHISKIQGQKGVLARGRYCWSKDQLDPEDPRLTALIKAGRVTKNF